MKKWVVLIVFAASFFCLSKIAGAKAFPLKVASEPSGALLSIHLTKDAAATEGIRKVAGETPVSKNFDFPKENMLCLEMEKRGYLPKIVEVTPETKTLTVKLEKIKDPGGQDIAAYAIPSIKRLLVVTPEFDVIKRGFASEEVASDESALAKNNLIKGIQKYFADAWEVKTVPASAEDRQTKPLWRDTRTAMDLIDPIRLKYLSYPPRLETKGGRKAAQSLGSNYGGEAILLLSGKMNRETASMVLGKIGIFAAGTATSYSAGYANAAARGDSFFMYTVYIPRIDQGMILKAMLIDAASGEIVWTNKGLWGLIDFNNTGEVDKLMEDLFSGLTRQKRRD